MKRSRTDPVTLACRRAWYAETGKRYMPRNMESMVKASVVMLGILSVIKRPEPFLKLLDDHKRSIGALIDKVNR